MISINPKKKSHKEDAIIIALYWKENNNAQVVKNFPPIPHLISGGARSDSRAYPPMLHFAAFLIISKPTCKYNIVLLSLYVMAYLWNPSFFKLHDLYTKKKRDDLSQ